MQEFLKNYWPLVLFAAWVIYKKVRAHQIQKELPALQAQGAIMLDVRSIEEFASGNAPGSINIPLGDLGSRMSELPKNVPIIVACASGMRSGAALMMLKKNGYDDVRNIGSWTSFVS